MGAAGSESDGCDSYLFSKEIQHKSIFRKSISDDRCAGGCLSDLHYSAGKKIAKYLSRPLEELTEEIQSMDEMNIQATVHSNREDEMGILINSYNHMMQRIQELIRENYETQIARKEFEMKALQAQINPHFLYNSLSMINWKAIEAGEEESVR